MDENYTNWEGVLDDQRFRTALFVCGAFAAGSFAVSTASHNYSQVDKLWSITPVVYAWIAVRDDRTRLMAILATIWGVRLTYNFYRRGGYTWPPWQGDEDYRWERLQKGELVAILRNPFAWSVFNLTFISTYQHVLLLFIATPAFATAETPLGVKDWLLALLFIGFVIIESVADNTQFVFQEEKYRRKRSGVKLTGEFADGFRQSGLFAIVRKPNYAAEQMLWIVFFLFTISSGAPAQNWSAMGWIQLCVLFQSSGWLTEKISKQKYPKYDAYATNVPLYVPNPLRLLQSNRIDKSS